MQNIEFIQNLKRLRKEYGIAQSTLADKLNVSVKSVSHWETGYTEPSLSQLIQLADVFDVSIDELVGRI